VARSADRDPVSVIVQDIVGTHRRTMLRDALTGAVPNADELDDTLLADRFPDQECVALNGWCSISTEAGHRGVHYDFKRRAATRTSKTTSFCIANDPGTECVHQVIDVLILGLILQDRGRSMRLRSAR